MEDDGRNGDVVKTKLNEQIQWMLITNPIELIHNFFDKRLLRLAACAIVRHFGDTDEICVHAAEKYADNPNNENYSLLSNTESKDWTAGILKCTDALSCLVTIVVRTRVYFASAEGIMCDIIRSIFSPFEKRVIKYKNKDVIALAKIIYDDYDFGLMPILKDTLIDAGNTCDLETYPCRGCWLLDSILRNIVVVD